MELNLNTPRVFLPALEPAKYIAIYGGRGSGKSHFAAELVVEGHLMEKRFSVCGRETQKSLENSSKKLIEHKIESMNAGAYFEVQDRRILSKLGGKIIFEGLGNHTTESIKSLAEFDEIWVDEAQCLSQHSIDILRPTLRKSGARFMFTWNPSSPTDPIDLMFRTGKPPPRSVIIQANYSDNPFFPDILHEEMTYDKERDYDKYLHVWEGQYAQNSEARVFKNWVIEECEPGPESIIRCGADWGFSIDPSVLVRTWMDGKALYIDYEAYQIGCEIDNLPDLLMSVPDSEIWPLVADNARPETISYLRKHGFPKILPAIKGARSLEEGVEFLKSYNIIVHPRCKHLISELTMYSYKIDEHTGQVLPMLEDKNNHCIDALRYACEAVRRSAKKSVVVSRKIAPTFIPSPTGWMG